MKTSPNGSVTPLSQLLPVLQFSPKPPVQVVAALADAGNKQARTAIPAGPCQRDGIPISERTDFNGLPNSRHRLNHQW